MNRCLRFTLLLTVVLGFLSSCGYHTGGKADLVPKTVQTIAIPAFANSTVRYRLADALPEAIAVEFRTRTRFHTVTDAAEADAVLQGKVISAVSYPVITDPTSGRITAIRSYVTLTVSLIENKTGKVLYSRPNWALSRDYATALNSHQLFDESGPALERLTRDVAHDVVSAVLENF